MRLGHLASLGVRRQIRSFIRHPNLYRLVLDDLHVCAFANRYCFLKRTKRFRSNFSAFVRFADEPRDCGPVPATVIPSGRSTSSIAARRVLDASFNR
jgi:hypothetical protein